VTLPKDASVKSIVTFILQLMGITWPRIRKLLAKHIGEENVALIEKVYSIVANLIALGPEGVFEMIKEKLNPATILNQIINAAVDYMIKAVIKAVSARIILLFNPVGAILQALEAIYKVLKWIFVNAARIFRLVETIVNGIADIIAGSIGGLANAVESALGQLIAPVIDFLADYLGFGDLPDKVKDTIIGLQAWVESILDEVIGWLVAKGKELLKAIGLGGEDKDKKDGHDANVGEKVPFTADGKGHSLWVNVHGESAVLMVASDVPMTIEERLSAWSADAKNLPKGKTGEESPQAKAEKLIPQAESLLSATDKTAEDLIRTSHKSNEDEKESAPTSGEQAELSDEEHKLADILQQLFEIFGEHGSPPLVGTYGDLRARRKERPDNEVHHVPPKALLAWMKDVAEKARNDLSQSEIAKGIDFGWVTQLAQTHQSVYEPGNPLSSISVHRETHIKKSGEPTTDVWRIHWGAETAKAVFGRLKDKTVTVIVNGTPTKLSIVFIRRKLFADLSPEDQILAKELEKEAEETMPGSEVGTIPDAAGLVISTQFFKTELWSALREAQSQAEIDVGKLAENLGKVARGAAAIAQVAVEEALKASERDGSEDEKAAAVADLKQLSIEIWTKLPGVEGLNIL
jgi:hypothetical protein